MTTSEKKNTSGTKVFLLLQGLHLGTHHMHNIGLSFLQALMSLDQNLENYDNYPECQTSIEKDQSMKITRWVNGELAVYRAVHQKKFLLMPTLCYTPTSNTGGAWQPIDALSPPCTLF